MRKREFLALLERQVVPDRLHDRLRAAALEQHRDHREPAFEVLVHQVRDHVEAAAGGQIGARQGWRQPE